MHRSIHPVNTPCQYTCQHNLSIPPLVNQHTPCQSTDPVNIPPYQHTYQHAVSTPLSPYLVNQHPLSTHPVNTLYQLPCHRTLSINTPYQHTLSIHCINSLVTVPCQSTPPVNPPPVHQQTIMIATIRTGAEYYQQTAVTLMYASRAKKVKNRSLVNRNVIGDTGIHAG